MKPIHFFIIGVLMLVFVWITRTVEGGTGFRKFVKKRVDEQKNFLKKVGNAVLTKKQMNDIKNSKKREKQRRQGKRAKRKRKECDSDYRKCEINAKRNPGETSDEYDDIIENCMSERNICKQNL